MSSIKEYCMKINGKKSKVVCINGAKEERSWNFGGCEIGEVEEYKYLGVTVKAGLNGGFKSMGDKMVDANGVLGMVKYAAARLEVNIIIIIFIRINNYTYRVHIKHLSTNYIKIFRIENKLYYNNYFYKIIVIQYNI